MAWVERVNASFEEVTELSIFQTLGLETDSNYLGRKVNQSAQVLPEPTSGPRPIRVKCGL